MPGHATVSRAVVAAYVEAMNILIGTPVHGHQVSCIYLDSLDKFRAACRIRGWKCAASILPGVSDILWARNWIVHEFLKLGFDKLVFFDSDQGCEPEDILALVESGRPLAACPVTKKRDNVGAADAFNFRCEDEAPVIEGDFMRVDLVGTGLMCIDRDLLLRMCYEQPFFNFHAQPVPRLFTKLLMFPESIIPEEFSEDFSFCWLAQPEKPWIYLKAAVKHEGTKAWIRGLSQ